MYFFILIVLITILIFLKNFKKLKDFLRIYKYVFKFPTPDDEYSKFRQLSLFHISPVELFRLLRRRALSEKLYPLSLVNLGPFISLNIYGPEIVEAIISRMQHLEKSNLAYPVFENWLGKGLLTSSGDLWKGRRKILTSAFHFSILKAFVQIFNKESNNLVNDLKNGVSEEGKSLTTNLLPFIDNMTLRTINETSMGIKLNQDTSEGAEYKNNLKKACILIQSRMLKSWIPKWFYYTFNRDGIEELEITRSIHKFTENVIKKRLEHFQVFEVPDNHLEVDNFEFKKKKLAMLDLLLNEKVKNSAINDKGIRDEVNTFMFEGHDTTSSCLGFTLMLLACHKEIQDEVYAEMEDVLGPDHTKTPSYQNLQELNLMERCIKESLRLYPSVPFIGRVASEDIKTKIGLIPKGVRLHIHIYDIHHNPKLWPDPEKFDPSRFLLENCKNRHPFAYIPFSAGPRNCIGQRFALLEIKAALCNILTHFILEPIDTPETLVLFQDAVLRSKDGIKVKCRLRN